MPSYFDFEVSLREIEPRIWRRFLIRETATFKALHKAIQDACGWWNYHLFAFVDEHPEFGRTIAGVPDDYAFEGDEPVPEAARVKLASYFGPAKAQECLYQYDFGDGWEHDVVLKGVQDVPGSLKRIMLAGARAFPPEDCGGVPGYADCVRAALGKDKGVEDPEGLRTWLGGWHPEEFDLDRAKRYFDAGATAARLPGS